MDPFETHQLCAGLSRGPAPAFEAGPFPDAPGLARSAPSGVLAGSLGYGSGGPTWLDGYHSKRPPTPPELVNAFKAVAYACIKLNATGVARVPLRLYAVRRPGQRAPRRSFAPATDRVRRRMLDMQERGFAGSMHFGLARAIDTHDEIDEVLDHPLLEAMERPNPFFDKPTMMMYLVACLDAIGSAMIFPTRPVGADGLADPTWAARELWPLQSQYVYPVKATDGRLIGSWRYFGDTFEAKEVVRARWFSLRDPYLSAYAPLHACYEQQNIIDYYTASVEAILKGGARPDIVMTAKDPLYKAGDAERERFEADINNKRTGAQKGRVWVVDGAFDVHTPSYAPVDLGGHILTKEQRLLSANCFDVPISLLQSEDSNRATAQESTHQHQYYGIDPRCCLLAAAFTQQLAQPVDDRLFFLFDDPVTRDVERDTKVWGLRIADGRATPNEERADRGVPPVPWGDEPWIANSLTQPAIAAAAAEADNKAGTGEAPAGGTTPAVGATDDVQAQALNGAQISSLVEVIQNVRDGVIPAESAKALLKAAFPSLADEVLAGIVDPIEVKPPEPPTEPPPTPGVAGGPVTPAPAGRSALEGRMARVLDLIEGELDGRAGHAARAGNDHAGAGGATPE